VDIAYQTMLDQLGQSEPNLVALAQEYQQIIQRDYFHSALGQQVRNRLLAARGDN
jgi:hypothetical protein